MLWPELWTPEGCLPGGCGVSDLLPDQRHDSDAREDVLPGQALPGDPVGEGLCAVGPRLTQVSHEQRHVRPGGGDRNNMGDRPGTRPQPGGSVTRYGGQGEPGSHRGGNEPSGVLVHRWMYGRSTLASHVVGGLGQTKPTICPT